MNILQFTNDEVTPDDLEHLKALVDDGKDVTGLIASIIEKFEKAFASDNSNIEFELYDEAMNDKITGNIDMKSDLGIALCFNGYGDCCHQDDSGTPVYIEKYDGEVKVRVYGDINKEEPTQNISLEGARLEKRLPDEDVA